MPEKSEDKAKNIPGKILFYKVDPTYTPIFKKTFSESHIDVFESDNYSNAEHIIRNENPDILLADFDSGSEDALRLLKFVKDQFPSISRMAILKTEEQKKAIFLVFKGIANNCIEKPHGMVALMSNVIHILGIRKTLREKNILELLSTIENLIALPSTYIKFTEAMESNKPSEVIIDILENDMSISTKILQIANSAFFRENKISSISSAYDFLGAHNIKNIVTIFCYNSREKLEENKNQAFRAIIKHSVRVNRELFSSYELRTGIKLSDSFASVGITHDIGKIIILKYLPERFLNIIKFQEDNPQDDFYSSEIKLGHEGVTHEEIGAYLLDLWNLPEENVQTALYHHNYSEAMESYKPMFEIFKDVNYDMEIIEYTKMFDYGK
jgi:HD-like signal output (HDOD) protein